MEQQAGEDQEVQTRHGGRWALVVAHRASEACHPPEAEVDHPSVSRQDDAPLGLGRQLAPSGAASWTARAGGSGAAGGFRCPTTYPARPST